MSPRRKPIEEKSYAMHFDQLKRRDFITLLGGRRRRGRSRYARCIDVGLRSRRIS
jgi:hypothetical protein